MKKFRQLSEQLDVSSEHGPNAGRFASGAAKKVISTQPQATPRREVDEAAPEAGDDINNQPSPALVRKNGKIKSADALPDAEMGGTMSRYMPEARMSAAVKLQRAFERQQEKSAASRKRAEELMRPKQEPVKPVKESFAETIAHKDKANAAYESGDSHAFHGHMVDHHVAMADFHRQHGDEKSAQKHEDKAKEHHSNMQTYYREDVDHIDEKISVASGPAPRQQGRFAPNNQIRTDRTPTGGRIVTGVVYTGNKKPKPVKEEKDEQEYGYEGDMALNQLATLTRCAEMIRELLKPDTDMPEWVQSKITLATDYIQTAADYMHSEMKEEVEKPTGELKDACWTGYTAVGMKMKNGRKVPNCVPVKEDAEQLEEGRPSQRHPLEGHEYHRKTNAELEYIAKDAHKAAEAMKSHNTTAENKYRDQANDSATVRHFRKTSGTPDWYKKKYGHVNEETVNEVMDEPNYKLSIQARQKKADDANKPPFDGPYKKMPTVVTDKSGAKHGPMSRVRDLARDAMKKVSSGLPKKKLTESRKAEIVKQASKDAKKKTKEKDKEIATDKFQAQPTLDSQVIKTD